MYTFLKWQLCSWWPDTYNHTLRLVNWYLSNQCLILCTADGLLLQSWLSCQLFAPTCHLHEYTQLP